MGGQAGPGLGALLFAAALCMGSGRPAVAAPPAAPPACGGIGRAASPLVPGRLPVDSGYCDGVRPGALIRIDSVTSAWCTANFVFYGSDGGTYLGTAGHCVDDGTHGVCSGEDCGFVLTWPSGGPPVTYRVPGTLRLGDPEKFQVGEVAYANWTPWHDFTLIRVDAGVPVNPALSHWGGPTALNTAHPDQPAILRFVGNGTVVSEAAPARTAYALTLSDPRRIQAFPGTAIFGDSGGPVILDDGRALGVVWGGGYQIAITPLDWELAKATEVTGLTYTLRTAPLERH